MKRVVRTLLPFGILVAIVGLVVVLRSEPEAAKDYEVAYQPEQPIAFSHQVHAGKNEIDCEYCHIYARRSPSSGVPPTSVCMNCHKVIPGSQKPEEVAKLKEYWQQKEPIEWVKVHDTQDFVYYTHRAHVQIGEELSAVGDEGFVCQDCHGPVEQMDTAALRAWDPDLEETPLTMGWCMTCHKQKSEDVAYVEKLKDEAYGHDVSWQSLIGEVPRPTDAEVFGTRRRLIDCWTCHK